MSNTTETAPIAAPFIAPLKHVERAVVVRVASAWEPDGAATWIAGTVVAAGYLPGIHVGEVVNLDDDQGTVVCAYGTTCSIVMTVDSIERARSEAERIIRDFA